MSLVPTLKMTMYQCLNILYFLVAAIILIQYGCVQSSPYISADLRAHDCCNYCSGIDKYFIYALENSNYTGYVITAEECCSACRDAYAHVVVPRDRVDMFMLWNYLFS
jgi:hypothetical protein